MHRWKGSETPSISAILSVWHLNPVALAALVFAGSVYAWMIVKARQRGTRWPVLPTLGFYLLGLGSYAAIEMGFLGFWSRDLRWAFTTRLALQLFVVPSLLVIGKPVMLAREALTGLPLRLMERALRSLPARALGNAIVAPLLVIGSLLTLLTPLAYQLRVNPVSELSVTLLVPVVGLLIVLPIADTTLHRTSFFITIEFMLSFVELLVDSLPGILLRINTHVLDNAPPLTGSFPAWFPNPLRDQQLAGDMLWFIAQFTDLPIIIVLFLRWMRTDRKEADEIDELSDEEMEALMQEHLHGHRETGTPGPGLT